ncbi:MAG: hypothetical protein GZ091_04185 [Paludibacter sp.]|nr:hypothetical protein [Paludibacter sp.]
MKKNKFISLIILTTAFVMVGCTPNAVENPIVITAGIAKIGQVLDNTEKQFQLGDTIVYKFEVNSPNGIAKVEFSNFEGVGVNQKAPVVLSKVESLNGTTWTLVDTIKNIQTDMRYSVYIEDNNRQYKTLQVNAYLDISRYLTQTLYDGLPNGTSKTFMNVESGRTFFIANTIGDPTGIDFGFAYLENQPTVLACLVSFDEYWNTGNYSSLVNNLNQPTVFKKSTVATSTSTTWIKDKVKNSADLKTLFDAASNYPSILPLFPDSKVALNIKSKDVICFKTADGRYGLIQVTFVDPKSGSDKNTQKMNFAMVVEKKLSTNN